MSPTLVLIRHAEAYHNQTHKSLISLVGTEKLTRIPQDYSIPDPPLTELGVKQCQALHGGLQERFKDLPDPSEVLIIVSPMRRTLQTADIGLRWLVEKGVKVIANPDWQENSAKPCDTGSDLMIVQKDFSQVDFSAVDPVWPDKSSSEAAKYHYTRTSILARGQRALRDLEGRPESLIFIVSHSGFLRLGVAGWWWMNADYRIFHFVGERGSGGELRLEQDESTVRGGLGLSWDEPVELGFELPE